MQKHGRDGYSVHKKRDSVSTRLKLHTEAANDHGRHASIVKGKHASYASSTFYFVEIV